MSDFYKSIHTIVENQKKLGAVLLNTTATYKVALNHLHFLNLCVQLDFRLQIILDTLMLLEDAITFYQLGVMHPSIIKRQNFVYKLLQLQRNFLLVPVTHITINNTVQHRLSHLT